MQANNCNCKKCCGPLTEYKETQQPTCIILLLKVSIEYIILDLEVDDMYQIPPYYACNSVWKTQLMSEFIIMQLFVI